MNRALMTAFHRQLRSVKRMTAHAGDGHRCWYASSSSSVRGCTHASPWFATPTRLRSSTRDSAETSQPAMGLKHASGLRMTSAEFWDKVKTMVGQEDAAEEDFVIPRAAFDSIAQEYDELLEENAALTDKYARALAETENVRRRLQKQIDDARIFAIQGFCKDLLEVADILKMAASSIDPAELSTNASLASLHKGIVMTENVLMKTFAKHGLLPIAPEGEKFDPNLHEAIFQIPVEQAKLKPGMVEHVMKVGYSLNGRPIRPAQVGVVQP